MCVFYNNVLCYTELCWCLYNVGCVPTIVLCPYNCVVQYVLFCTIVLCYTICVVIYHRCCLLPYMWCCTIYVVLYNCVVFYNCVVSYNMCCVLQLCSTIVLFCTICVVIYDMIKKLPKTQLLKFIKYSPMQHKLNIRQHMLLIYQYDGCIKKSVYVACCAT